MPKQASINAFYVICLSLSGKTPAKLRKIFHKNKCRCIFLCISSNILHFFRHRAGSLVLIWLHRVFRILYKVSIVRSSNSCKDNTRKCYILSLSQKKMHYLRNFLFGWNLSLTFLVCRRGIGEKNRQVTKQKIAQNLLKNSNPR